MKVIRVSYTVQEEYIEHNKANIRAVMADLMVNPIDGMNYSSYYLGGGKFMHLNKADSEEMTKELGQREAFVHFRTELKGSQPISPPHQDECQLIGSNH